MTRILLENGYRRTGDPGRTRRFVYPRLGFSSKRPLTCISRLSLEFRRDGDITTVQAGATFTKIRWFTIAVFTLICVVAPILLGLWLHGAPEIPPVSSLGIPLGFLVHYHVRWRAFRTLRRLANAAGEVQP